MMMAVLEVGQEEEEGHVGGGSDSGSRGGTWCKWRP